MSHLAPTQPRVANNRDCEGGTEKKVIVSFMDDLISKLYVCSKLFWCEWVSCGILAEFLLGWNVETCGIQKALQGFFVTSASENRIVSKRVLNE